MDELGALVCIVGIVFLIGFGGSNIFHGCMDHNVPHNVSYIAKDLCGDGNDVMNISIDEITLTVECKNGAVFNPSLSQVVINPETEKYVIKKNN